MMDLHAWKQGWLDRIVGLKYFNVFGPNEDHKGDMRSVVHKSFEQVMETGAIRLFKSYRPEYRDGEQKRDFLYVKDAVAMTLYLAANRNANGIFNFGSGQAHTWNELARAVFAALGRKPRIEYVEMPETIRDKYQYFTQADIGKLRAAGYQPTDHATRRRGARLRRELSSAWQIARQRNRSLRRVIICRFAQRRIPPAFGFIQEISRVVIWISDVSVRWTGHLSAISSSLARCSAVSEPENRMSLSIWSSMPTRVSHSAQSSAWIFRWRSSTVTRSSGQPFRRAYIATVIDVQDPSAASNRS